MNENGYDAASLVCLPRYEYALLVAAKAKLDIIEKACGNMDAYANAQNEEEAAEILQSLVDIHGELAEKAENYMRVIKNVQSDVEGYKAEAKRLSKKATAGENL